MTEKIRAFIAIRMPDAINVALGGAVHAIDAAGIRGVRTVRSDGIHLTLKFLGDIERERVADVSEAIGRAASVVDPFELQIGEAGVFPNWRAPRVFWLGLEGELEALGRLHGAVESEIASVGFEPDTRVYQPHLTLARIRDNASPDDRRQAADVFSSLALASELHIDGDHASLMRTTFTPQGAVHDALFTAQLGSDGG
ncbi:MAG: RNA 2',3'-cyclic phosphodiesterase [SAR202 cluster bacterium]|jgi:2'-5' RNA ligase|nr:RNA 2',3'-cyclic phosphodiesterase [Chloroflexota bacterium]MDP6421038.1 RNA 2',3'-cyclic phosphodiesterase [SAR202 cluster bacterium]MDP6664195.1 RNA 2',3'-cyclic phosphodiesterase [SAR202 cluster bacterium]MDP6799089.1 RNA 2',3'-cyclic phosphodiesterase [SAR202 cluster bacterium]MQG58189.1 RNA 2',3'-cyclic phosphodiesterase [SAR202 cluster bacterium]|tara:strand:+ start:1902 stop:2495 length:594 start_codon:yes stop_codon:yes gene_type:complete